MALAKKTSVLREAALSFFEAFEVHIAKCCNQRSVGLAAIPRNTGVCEKSTPPEKRTLGKFSLKNTTTSGAGEGFLLPGCMAKARAKGMFLFTDTGEDPRD